MASIEKQQKVFKDMLKDKLPIMRYCQFYENNPYYIYRINPKTGEPLEIFYMWQKDPKSALWLKYLKKESRDIKVGKFTPEIGHKILVDSLNILFRQGIPDKFFWKDPNWVAGMIGLDYYGVQDMVALKYIPKYPVKLKTTKRR